MDMTRNFIEKIEELSQPNYIERQGRMFTDKLMTALPCGPVVENPLQTESLSSVVDYIDHDTDRCALGEGRFVIHVAGPEDVFLYKEMDQDKRRDCLLHAQANVSAFPFDRFLDVESFIINLQSNFIQNAGLTALLAFTASVKSDSSVEQTDDGISQRATVRSGISLTSNAKTPNPISLRPYRTFSEVDQMESPFVFRIKREDRSGITMALFKAGGSAWEHEAILGIREYFQEKLKDKDVILLA